VIARYTLIVGLTIGAWQLARAEQTQEPAVDSAPSPVPAGQAKAQEPTPGRAHPAKLPGVAAPGTIQGHQERVSTMVEAMVRRTDALFGGDGDYDLPSGSYLRLGARGVLYRPEDRDSDFSAIVSAKIRLPRSERRLVLLRERLKDVIASRSQRKTQAAEEEPALLLEENIEDVQQSPSQREAQAAIDEQPIDITRYLGLRTATAGLKLRISTDVGMQLETPFNPYVRLRIERAFLAGGWVARLSETLLYRLVEDGTAATELRLFRELDKRTVLTLTSNATWRQERSRWDLSEVANITRRIDARSLIAGEAGVLGETEPKAEATAYYASLRYRRKLYGDWLLMEVRPQLTYPRDRNYEPLPSITLQIEAYFGKGFLDRL
jgi:hypothetical protein